eukprot:Gregarina_sp_Poly_1__4487@NODE_240_length_10883_cov_144_711446_g211_i0_p11_GENE_NODE_240_length_10883_cov_144_711446_g211_i0NODE_240_length_10883_cov_144_711446_g211_i0_p11_ORF_typecomplete_len128_score12_61_NODE_240_length_10883_cov_144_711446_g211_i039184301
MISDLDFGMQLGSHRDPKLEDFLSQVKALTGFISSFYTELRRQDGGPNNLRSMLQANTAAVARTEREEIKRQELSPMSVITGTSGALGEGHHFVLPSTSTPRITTDVPEIYYEIFKSYKDRRNSRAS